MGEERLGQHLLGVPSLPALAMVLEPPALGRPLRALGALQLRPPHAPCAPHLGWPLQGKEMPKANGHAPDETRAQTQEEAGDVTTTPHIISKTHRLCGALPGTAPGKGQVGDGSCACRGQA